jgi:uroporphyrin-III C-methyltransferase
MPNEPILPENFSVAEDFQQGAILYLIGAGPGDPELLTIKALKILNSVDLVMFDNLVDRRILDYIENPNIETVFSGKGVGESFKQQDINKNILSALKQGKTVARLKGGDPLIFARGIEEAQVAIENGFKVEVIPGLTTAFSAAAINNKTLTLRNKVDSVILATGHELNEEKFQIWTQALKSKHVLILYMALRNIVTITDRLKEELGANFPVTAIYKASLIDQKVLDSDLEHVSQEIINQKFESPVIFYFGKDINHLNNIKPTLELSNARLASFKKPEFTSSK